MKRNSKRRERVAIIVLVTTLVGSIGELDVVVPVCVVFVADDGCCIWKTGIKSTRGKGVSLLF